MAKSDTEKVPIMMRRGRHGLEPVSAIDAEMLDRVSPGAQVEVSIKQHRTPELNRFYWVGLARAVEATGRWPDAVRMHKAIKMDLGYTTPILRFDGKVDFIPDSTAFSKMDQVAFKAFFERARELVIRTLEFDPWEMEAA